VKERSMEKINKRKVILGILIVSISLFGLVKIIKMSRAQNGNGSLTVPINLQMTEYLDKSVEKINISSIDINLPSITWNITDLDLNFAGIRPGQETKTIEDDGFGTVSVNRYNIGWGVEVNLSEPTIIYGVYIYGYLDGTPQQNVYVHINGYNKSTNTPNNTIFGTPVLINMSSTENWYLQKFTKPISLPTGQYYLVVNGTEMTTIDYAYYNWFYNSEDPIYPDLHISHIHNEQNIWQDESEGIVLRYKLVQRANKLYNPQEINLTANINEVEYTVSNGMEPGTGSLTLSDLDLSPAVNNFHIPIRSNQSHSLLFNLSLNLSLKNNFFPEGLVIISENSYNEWSIIPTISRFDGNYFIIFKIPINWYNLKIYKNRQDITSEISINGVNVYIPNNIITDDATWLIHANSPNTAFSLNCSETEFEPEQDLNFSVEIPISEGYVTFKLLDDSNIEYFSETREVISKVMTFSYVIPSDFDEGLYKIYIYWNNDTESGVQTQAIYVKAQSSPLQQLPFIIVLSVLMCSVVSLISYKKMTSMRNSRDVNNQKVLCKYLDVFKLNYIIINEKKTGLYVFEQKFAEMKIDMLLVSGFLEAIRRFGIDVITNKTASPILKIEFEKSMILMSEHEYFRIILIMKEKPSQDFLITIKNLSKDIDKEFGRLFENYKNNRNLKQFYGIKEIIEKHLKISMALPLKVVIPNGNSISQKEKDMINKATEVMRRNDSSYFYVSYLKTTEGFNLKNLEIIINLIDKKIFQPFYN